MMMTILHAWIGLGILSWTLLVLGLIGYDRHRLEWQDLVVHLCLLPIIILTGPLTLARFIL